MSPSRTVESSPAKPRKRRRIDHREVQLLVGCTEAIEQIEGLVEYPPRTRLVAIDLVDDDDGSQSVLERLLRHEPRLRHGSVHRVHQQQHAVDHGEHALDFAAEIGMARRVDDVDAIVAPGDRRVLGENRDAALALEHVGVHDALLHILARIERAGLA